MLWEIFLTFFKIGGAFTFGGGFAMIPIIQQEIVEKKELDKRGRFHRYYFYSPIGTRAYSC